MKYSKGTLMRFPLIFGGILLGFSVAFYNRDKFMTDLEEERNKLNREEEGSRQILLEAMETVNKARADRQQNK
uniref:Putative conserved secreted protein n=1 Tax=Culex tarsalis TaxID=7177 RepID=A0A1Q3FU86_CULTA